MPADVPQCRCNALSIGARSAAMHSSPASEIGVRPRRPRPARRGPALRVSRRGRAASSQVRRAPCPARPGAGGGFDVLGLHDLLPVVMMTPKAPSSRLRATPSSTLGGPPLFQGRLLRKGSSRRWACCEGLHRRTSDKRSSFHRLRPVRPWWNRPLQQLRKTTDDPPSLATGNDQTFGQQSAMHPL